MDTILDTSLLQQVVSRAYRMGCRQSVVVNQLIMKGTIEEIIYKYENCYHYLNSYNFHFIDVVVMIIQLKITKIRMIMFFKIQMKYNLILLKQEIGTIITLSSNHTHHIISYHIDNILIRSNLPLMHFLVKKLQLLR